MLEWLKTILGDKYTEDIDKKVSEEIGSGFVAKADFNAVNQEKKALADTVKERDKQLEDLKKETGDAKALQEKIEKLQAENKTQKETHDAEMKKLKVDTAVEMALNGAKAKNNVAVRALLNDFLSKAELAEDGSVKGLADEVKKLTEGEDTSFLFEKASGGKKFKGAKSAEHGDNGGSGGGGEPDFSKMSYDELEAYMEDNPDSE